MTQFLVFRLYGPLAAWGDIAVGERRPTANRPSRSGVLGLVASALGIERIDQEKQTLLRDSLGIASRVDVPGRLMHDYHTAQVPSESWSKEQTKRWKDKPRHAGPLWTRGEELEDRDGLSTILSERAYLADTLTAVAVWLRTPDGTVTLSDVEQALRRPVFAPFLGRKSCPPALPFAPRLVEAAHPVVALQAVDFATKEAQALNLLLGRRFWPEQILRTADEQKRPVGRQFAWEGQWPAVPDLAELVSVERRDDPGRRRAWQFHTRIEHIAHEVPQERAHG